MFNQTRLQGFDSPRIARVQRHDGCIERVETRHLAAFFQNEARAIRRHQIAGWATAAVNALHRAAAAVLPHRASPQAARHPD